MLSEPIEPEAQRFWGGALSPLCPVGVQEKPLTSAWPGGRHEGAPCSPSCWREGLGTYTSPFWPLSPDLEENEVSVLDTDYNNYLFFCMENAEAPGKSLVCQCLSTPPLAPGAPCVGGG